MKIIYHDYIIEKYFLRIKINYIRICVCKFILIDLKTIERIGQKFVDQKFGMNIPIPYKSNMGYISNFQIG